MTVRLPVAPSIAARAIAVLAAFACGATVRAGHLVHLIDADLEPTEVELVAAHPARISFFDADGLLQRAGTDDLVAIRFFVTPPLEPEPPVTDATDEADGTDEPGETNEAGEADQAQEANADAEAAAPVLRPHRLRLSDGQVLTGRRVGVDGEGRLLFDSPDVGSVAVELDRIRSFELQLETSFGEWSRLARSGATQDVVALANGDVLAGFIDAISQSGVTLSTDDGELDLPWDAIRRLALSNPMDRAAGIWVDLADGSRYHVDTFALDDEALVGVVFGDRSLNVDAREVRTIEFATRRRLIGIAELPVEAVSGGDVFGLAYEPTIEPGVIHAHAPMRIEFTLPDGARRFIADARLGAGVNAWSDLTVRLSDNTGTLVEQRLNRAGPLAHLSVEPRGDRLIIEVVDGVNGPIGDRLELHDAYLLVENEP